MGSGTPNGNNAAGAALGPATGSANRIEITNWTSYLSNAFGKGINPTLDGNINYLYPLDFQVSGNLRGNSDSSCSPSGSVRSVSGTVNGVRGNVINLTGDNGQTYELTIGQCTQLLSNQADATVAAGDQVIARGTQNGYNGMSCQNGIVLKK